jgi:hypothetical protein
VTWCFGLGIVGRVFLSFTVYILVLFLVETSHELYYTPLNVILIILQMAFVLFHITSMVLLFHCKTLMLILYR